MNKTSTSINDCLELVEKKPGFLDYLKLEETEKNRRRILDGFFQLHGIDDWEVKISFVYYAIQEKFDLDLGFCPYFKTSDIEGKLKNFQEGKNMFVFDSCSKTGEKKKIVCQGIKDNCVYDKDE